MQLETPGGRGYSLNFVDHEGLLHNFAKKGFARLQAARVSWVDYDEVFGQMGLYFKQASLKFDPTRGITFTAYLGRVCMNNFNKWAADLIAEQTNLGLTRVSDLDSKEDFDFYELHAAGEDESPEEIIERYDYIHKTRCAMSEDAKAVVKELANAFAMRQNLERVKAIGERKGWQPARIRAVRAELTAAFGVKV